MIPCVATAATILLPVFMTAYLFKMSNWCQNMFKFQWVPGSKSSLINLDKTLRSTLVHKNHGEWVQVKHDNTTHDIWTVTVEGDVPNAVPIVVIHGMGGGSNMFLKNIDSFAKQRDVFLIDLPGFGLSSRPDFDKTLDEESGRQRKTNEDDIENFYTQVLDTWFETMKLDKAILLGHSFGGYISSVYCLSHPERVKHLILADPWGYGRRRAVNPSSFRMKVIIFLMNKLYYKVNMFTPIRALGPLGPSAFRRLRGDLNERYNTGGPDDTSFIDYLYACNTAGKPSGEIGFAKMSYPLAFARKPMVDRVDGWDPDLDVTFICGKDSWMGSSQLGEVLEQRSNSYTDIQVVEGAGHHVHTDNAPLFNWLVRRITMAVDAGRRPDLESVSRKASDASLATDRLHLVEGSDA